MAKVIFTLEDKDVTGEVTCTQVIIESGFKNEGQAHVWLAEGAKQRYGAVFWHRVAKIEVTE
ncbi:hypothetical protein LCGC14_0207760 [marine sediment metagenome]|uniref:Uncharacterized protein n=1 Tax=marine sediment metagenome TaxID=412755 RepID=A0A0F9UGG2_9ZZZZ